MTLLQIFVYLVRNNDVLNTGQQHLSLVYTQAQRFHRQLRTLDCQHLAALFAAVGVYAYHLDPDTHDRNLRLAPMHSNERWLPAH